MGRLTGGTVSNLSAGTPLVVCRPNNDAVLGPLPVGPVVMARVIQNGHSGAGGDTKSLCCAGSVAQSKEVARAVG